LFFTLLNEVKIAFSMVGSKKETNTERLKGVGLVLLALFFEPEISAKLQFYLME
jgi:hypothetical protein